jgi:hypothetical protein
MLLIALMAALMLAPVCAQTMTPQADAPPVTELNAEQPQTSETPATELRPKKDDNIGAGLTYVTTDPLDKFWIEVSPRIKHAGWAGLSGRVSSKAIIGIVSFFQRDSDQDGYDRYFGRRKDCNVDSGPRHSGLALLGNYACPIGKANLIAGAGLVLDIYSDTRPALFNPRYKEAYTSLSVKPVAQLGLRFTVGHALGFELGYSTNGAAYMTVGLW